MTNQSPPPAAACAAPAHSRSPPTLTQPSQWERMTLLQLDHEVDSRDSARIRLAQQGDGTAALPAASRLARLSLTSLCGKLPHLAAVQYIARSTAPRGDSGLACICCASRLRQPKKAFFPGSVPARLPAAARQQPQCLDDSASVSSCAPRHCAPMRTRQTETWAQTRLRHAERHAHRKGSSV